MGLIIRFFLESGRPAFGWEGPASDEFAATSMAWKSYAMACRAIAFARGKDPDSIVPPQAEARVVRQAVNERYVDWSIARALLEALPGRPKKGVLDRKLAREILLATFAGKAQQQMTGSFNGASLGFSVMRPNILDGVFTIRSTGLVLQTGAIGRPEEWDPMDTAEANALGCAYAARNEKPRNFRSTDVNVTISREPSATLRAAAVRRDPRSVELRSILEAISGTRRAHRTAYA